LLLLTPRGRGTVTSWQQVTARITRPRPRRWSGSVPRPFDAARPALVELTVAVDALGDRPLG
jgi:hypothetical protein